MDQWFIDNLTRVKKECKCRNGDIFFTEKNDNRSLGKPNADGQCAWYNRSLDFDLSRLIQGNEVKSLLFVEDEEEMLVIVDSFFKVAGVESSCTRQ